MLMTSLFTTTPVGDFTFLNSFRNGSWEKEECTVPDKSFTKGGTFQMFIAVTSDGHEAVPCMTKISPWIKQDTAVVFQGTLPTDATKFTINFKTGGAGPDSDDIAFHYNPRLGDGTYLNSFRNGNWEKEETVPDKPPAGGAFIILVVINSEGYELCINFKTGPSDADDIAFHCNPRAGDFTFLNSFRSGSWEKEETVPDKSFTKGGTFQMFIAVTSDGYEAVPCMTKISPWIKQDTAVVFQGTLPTDATKFTINFKTGPADSDDIAFHYNPRLGDGTYLNSFRNGNWEKEETVPDKPFARGGAFIILVVINSEGYEALPYVAKIPGGLKQDMAVFLQGTVLADAKRFTINFKTGPADSDDIAFHYNPRIGDGTYLNSFRNGNWEKEETVPDKPFARGGAFIILVVINSEGYEALPYVAKIPGGLKQDMAVFLQGTVLADAKSFAFNFKTGPSDADDIAFHYNPRAGDFTFLNSFRNGSWEKEETVPDKSFTKGGAFQMFIAVTSDGYEAVPCMTKISPWIKQDTAVVFQGTLPTDATKFTINFKTGPADSDDIAFHYNPRIGDGTYLNSFRNGNWEKEETVPDKPFARGGAFIILVVINSEGYEALPYVAKIPGGLKQDMAVFLQGTVLADAKSFAFNFKTGPSDADDIAFHYNPRLVILPSSTASEMEAGRRRKLYLINPSPREEPSKCSLRVTSDGYEIYHKFQNGAGLIVMTSLPLQPRIGDGTYLNSFRNGNWEKEETVPDKPFARGGAFIILVVINSEGYEALPYVAKIPGGLKQDMAVFLQGTVLADAKSFAFNFKTGPSDADDIAFHYNPRAGDFTFLNSFRNGSWEKEETVPDKSFTKGGAFQMFIAVTSDGYEIYHKFQNGAADSDDIAFHYNPRNCFAFNFKTGPSDADDIAFHYNPRAGDFTFLNSFRNGSWEKEETVPDKSFTKGGAFQMFIAVTSDGYEALPCVAKIPQGIKQDIAVVFQGTVPADATGFAINFKTGPAEGDDVAFHYNPRIGDRTYLNSFRNRNFEKEETVPDKPFARGGAFIILVVINSEGYESWSTTSSFKELKKITTTQGPTSSLTSLPLEISHPIIYPALPYVVEVPGGINQDKAVFFQGTVPADAKSFTINFKTGPADADDIAFHYNPRIGDHTALNSVRNGSWETEETAPDKPFTAGQTFQLIIVINSEGYEVYVNGLRHCTFKHRIPLEKVSTLGIGGDLSNVICGFIHGWRTSSFFTEIQEFAITDSSTTALNISHPITNPALPYVGKIPGGIQKDMAVFFQGTIPQDAKGFIINFKTGPADADDIAFHYNPRIGDHTALNSVRNGSWETEETAPDKPFTAGQTFQLIIVINSEGYEVYVNGLRHCTFKHRIPLEKVSTLGIGGDLSNVICGFIHSWTTSSFFTELQEFEITGGSSTSVESTALNISHPITNPALPYVGKIPGGIQKDMAVFFQGTIPQDTKGFIINFKTGPADADDIAFHYNLRTGDHTALNSFRNGSWETEETAPDKPFTAGQTFQLIIVINSEGYEVYVNGLKHCVFKHRISLEQVSTLGIEGDVLISICGFIHNWSASSIFTEFQQIQSTQSTTSTTITLEISQPISNPAIPYVGKIPIVVKPNVAVLFQGSVLENAVGFEINFKTGSSDDAIAFHFKPHMGEYTALNSFRNGIWEKQENAPIKPFIKGGAFQIIVAFKSEGYEVYVNGLKYCTFKHRIPLEKVCLIGISGETTIQLIGFVENWSA
ncbi:hypothetical protein AMELA_G00041280 [Ameiurus melas]|uniref:Galectin domain-containing protein n=1 Tax=Ameiurus melas TaxID=219545 RepID=A0A7J6BA58_AMEME|nr:hypothetical protein AMELA_G00041280 [Ameiurus melas]